VLVSVLLFLNLGGGEVFLIVMVMLMFFGSDKLPGIAKGLGKGLRELNDAKSQIQDEIARGTEGVASQIRKHTEEVQEEINKAGEGIKKQVGNVNSAMEDQARSIEDTLK
jgi:sec-independent protein translocase protein TatA